MISKELFTLYSIIIILILITMSVLVYRKNVYNTFLTDRKTPYDYISFYRFYRIYREYRKNCNIVYEKGKLLITKVSKTSNIQQMEICKYYMFNSGSIKYIHMNTHGKKYYLLFKPIGFIIFSIWSLFIFNIFKNKYNVDRATRVKNIWKNEEEN